MKIMAFDLATNTGIAIGDARDRPYCHSERLGQSGHLHGARFFQAFSMTARLIKQHSPDLIVIEQPIASGVTGAASRVQLAMGLRASVMAVAYGRGIKCEEYPVQSIRKHFIGNAKMKRTEAKAATIERCKLLGWHVANDNEADAAAVWDYTRAKHLQISTPPNRSLFEHADSTISKHDQ